MINKFATVYAGHIDFPDHGQNATPANERGFTNDQYAVDRGAPPPTRNAPGQPFSKPPPPLPQGGIIGLFPEPGAPR